MSKPKKGYQRKSLDLKEKTLEKAAIAAIKKGTTAKELLEGIIETQIKTLKP